MREIIRKICKIMTIWYKNHIKLNKIDKSPFSNDDDWCYNAGIGKTTKEGGHNMATVFDVAKYILNNKGNMTTMKLEKLVYYSQAWSLAWDGKPLFDEDFQAWANGPVCPDLFYSHKGQYVVSKSFYDQRGNIDSLDEDEIETINVVLEHYGNKEPQWLSDLTHKERPWRESRQGVPAGMRSDNIVLKETMQDYYGGLS